jgi:hypothetical protein
MIADDPHGSSRGPVELVVGDAARGDLDEHVAQPWLGIGRILVDKHANARWFVDADGLHRLVPFVHGSKLS